MTTNPRSKSTLHAPASTFTRVVPASGWCATPERLRDGASQSRQIIRRIVVPAWFAELMGDGASNDNQQNGNASA
jgi:hypothetical protein